MINQEQLKTDIKTLLDANKVIKVDQQKAIDDFAEALASKIADAIKRGIDTAQVTPVLTAGGTTVTGTITLLATK